MEKYEEAIECYDKTISIRSLYADAYYEKGNTLKAMGKNTEAADCYKRTLRLNPDHKDAMNKKNLFMNEMKAK